MTAPASARTERQQSLLQIGVVLVTLGLLAFGGMFGSEYLAARQQDMPDETVWAQSQCEEIEPVVGSIGILPGR